MGYAQECATPSPDTTYLQSLPWYGNPGYLEDKIQEVRSIQKDRINQRIAGVGGPTAALIRIPIQFVLANDDMGNRPLEPWQLEELLRLVNDFHEASNTNIAFYRYCEIIEINDNALNSMIGEDNLTDLFSTVNSNAAIDVIVVDTFLSDTFSGGFVGVAPFPVDNDPFHVGLAGSMVDRDLLDIAITLTHELGHSLNLLHTHQPTCNQPYNYNCRNCKQESVSRTRGNGIACANTGSLKCSSRGDLLCDTEADPLLSGAENFNANNCTYNGAGNTGQIGDEDRWGDAWNPDVQNMMGYGRRCRDRFSPMQGVVQLVTAGNQIPGVYPSPANDFDVFEPDNFPELAQPIASGEIQCRTFHLGGGTAAEPVACDEEWLSFTMSSFGAVKIKTWEFFFHPQPDTQLELFDDNLTLIASNDNFAGVFAWIKDVNLAIGNYFIRVTNRSLANTTEARGRYNISLEIGPPVGVEEGSDLRRLVRLYPNPSQGRINLEFMLGKPTDFSVCLRDLNGRVVQKRTIKANGHEEITLELIDLPLGMYLLELEGAGQRLVEKVIFY